MAAWAEFAAAAPDLAAAVRARLEGSRYSLLATTAQPNCSRATVSPWSTSPVGTNPAPR